MKKELGGIATQKIKAGIQIKNTTYDHKKINLTAIIRILNK